MLTAHLLNLRLLVKSGESRLGCYAAGRKLCSAADVADMKAAGFLLSSGANLEATQTYGSLALSHLTVWLLFALINLNI